MWSRLDILLKVYLTDQLMCFVIISLLISLIKSGAHSSKNKHIDINYHYIQDIVEKGEINVEFISSTKIVADPMTKGLPLDKFKGHVTTMGLKYI
jgi:hypothetical protein